MNLPREAINEFKVIFLQKFGEDLTDEKAQEQALELLNMYSLSQNQNIFYE